MNYNKGLLLCIIGLVGILLFIINLIIIEYTKETKYEYIVYYNVQYDDDNYVVSTVLDLDSEIDSYEDIVIVSDVLEKEFRMKYKGAEAETIKVILTGFDFLSKKGN